MPAEQEIFCVISELAGSPHPKWPIPADEQHRPGARPKQLPEQAGTTAMLNCWLKSEEIFLRFVLGGIRESGDYKAQQIVALAYSLCLRRCSPEGVLLF